MTSLIGERTPSKTAGLTYSVSVCVFFLVSLVFPLVTAGAEGTQWFLYANFLAAPIVFALTAAWYFSYAKTPLFAFAKEQKCHPKYYLIALLLQLGLLCLAELNTAFVELLGRFGYVDSGIEIPSTDGVGFLGVFVTVAILPALFEELFFRGVFLRETKEFSFWARVLLCGGLFALYHQNPAQTLYQFVCGAAFALVAIRAGSFLPTVLSHLINNGLIVVLYAQGIADYPKPVYAVMLALSGLCLVGTLTYLIAFDGKSQEKTPTKKGAYKQFFACAAFGVGVFALSWLATLISGF